MNLNRTGSGDLDAVKNDGTPVLHAQGAGITLPVGTYYIPLGGPGAQVPNDVPLVALHLRWDAALVATITIESSNFPSKQAGGSIGADDVNDYDGTAGNWVQENPTTAYVPVSPAGSATPANLTLAIPGGGGGGGAGGAMIHMGNLGSRRVRAKVVVTTQGLLRAVARGKD